MNLNPLTNFVPQPLLAQDLARVPHPAVNVDVSKLEESQMDDCHLDAEVPNFVPTIPKFVRRVKCRVIGKKKLTPHRL